MKLTPSPPQEASAHDRFLNLGAATPPPKWLVADVEEPAVSTEAEPPQPLVDLTFADEWAATPAVKDQESRFPDTVRVAYKKSVVFDLSKPEAAAQWNTMLMLAEKSAVVLCDIDRQFYQGAYYVYALVIGKEFKRIIPNPKA